MHILNWALSRGELWPVIEEEAGRLECPRHRVENREGREGQEARCSRGKVRTPLSRAWKSWSGFRLTDQGHTVGMDGWLCFTYPHFQQHKNVRVDLSVTVGMLMCCEWLGKMADGGWTPRVSPQRPGSWNSLVNGLPFYQAGETLWSKPCLWQLSSSTAVQLCQLG